MSNNQNREIFTFVILNYITKDDTEECVKSIKKYCKNYNYNIVVVDNASPNNSGNELKKIYTNDKEITVFLNKDNLGFAKGNNVGFKYAKDKLKSDYIILCNSDTEILSYDFCDRIIEKYKEIEYAVLGPKERLSNGTIFPLNCKIRSKKRLRIDINYFKSILDNKKLQTYLYKTLRKVINVIDRRIKLNFNKEHKDIVLHGAFLIFSKKYIDLFDGLNPITQFYGEEEFLMLRLKEYNLHSYYTPEIEILHKKGSSTNASSETEEQRVNFVAKFQLESCEKLLKALNGEIGV